MMCEAWGCVRGVGVCERVKFIDCSGSNDGFSESESV